MSDHDDYKTYLKSLSDTSLRYETERAVYDGHALRMEACRQQWIALGSASVFLECYNKAVNASNIEA